jgi:hypothetical protein
MVEKEDIRKDSAKAHADYWVLLTFSCQSGLKDRIIYTGRPTY